MSKSIGNVIAPKQVIAGDQRLNLRGASLDVLRYWALTAGESHPFGNASISSHLVQQCEERVDRLRRCDDLIAFSYEE